jgi:hypothetical protein
MSLRISRRFTLNRDPKSAEGREATLYFDRKGVRREDVAVTANPPALRERQGLSNQTEHPVIVVDGQVIRGCELEALEPLAPSRF